MPKARIIKIILALIVILLITTIIYFFRGKLFNINSKKSIDNDIEKKRDLKKLKLININNTFILRLIDSIQYKDVIIDEIWPITRGLYLPNSLESEFDDWLIISGKGIAQASSRINDSKQSPFPVHIYKILGAGGGLPIEYGQNLMTPFMLFLHSNKVFDRMKIRQCGYLMTEPVFSENPDKNPVHFFDIDCFPYDIKSENCDYKKLLNKTEKNRMIVDWQLKRKSMKTKYSDLKMECSTRNETSPFADTKSLDLMSAVGHEIIDIAEKSKINSIKRIKLTYEHQLVKTLIELDTDYDSVKCFFSNLTSSDYLFMIKLFGVNNPSFRVEAINKQRKINVFSKAKCVILIEFPVGVGVQ